MNFNMRLRPIFLLPLLLVVSPLQAVTTDNKMTAAIAQSFRTCDSVKRVDQKDTQFRIYSRDIWRKEFDLLDLEIDSVQGDRVYLTCQAPGCVAAWYSSGGKWNPSQPETSVALQCLGSGKKLGDQLKYFFEDTELKKTAITHEQSAKVKWRSIGKLMTSFGETDVELDEQSIQQGPASRLSLPIYGQKDDDIKSTWIRMTFPPFFRNGQSMSSSKLHVSSNCYLGTILVDQMIAYSGNRGSGTELANSDVENPQWVKPASGTPQALAHRALCR